MEARSREWLRDRIGVVGYRPMGKRGRGMKPEQGRVWKPGKAWLSVRWVSIIPALILIFFVASAAISPRTTQATDDPADPISPPSSLNPSSLYEPGELDNASPTPSAFAGNLTNLTGNVPQPTNTPVPVAASTPSATPSGPTPTPDKGAPGNAQPQDGVIRVPVLMYHYIRINPVASDRLGFGLSVTPTDFAAQMDWVAQNGYHAVFPSELTAAITRGAPLPTKPIVLTFDDGYRDFYDQAWPVLKRLGLKSSSAVITNFADRGDRGDAMYMSWNMIKELDQSGMVEIASHTQSHNDLTRLSVGQRWTELAKSKEVIEGQLGHPCNAFVYPSGKYNGATVADASRAGYQIAFTTNDGKVRAPQDGGVILQLPRVRVAGGTTIAGFAKNLS